MNESILLEYDTPPYSRKQIIENEMNHLGAVTIDTVIPPRYARVFHEKNFIPIDEYEDPTDAYWWIVVKAVKKKTKRGAHYLRLRVMGANGKQEWMTVGVGMVKNKSIPTLCASVSYLPITMENRQSGRRCVSS